MYDGAGLDRWLFDASVLNTHIWKRSSEFDSDSDATLLSMARLAGYRLFPLDTTALYAGGGVSLGQSHARYQNERYADDSYEATDEAWGVQAELTAGWEILRNRSMRVFFEAWSTLPLARTETEIDTPTETTQHRFWAPFFGLSTGIGF
ncbi:MAG: hypothetical protein AABZ30_14460 [Myxococcota bacterium]|mgnify:CR=1 FL=1